MSAAPPAPNPALIRAYDLRGVVGRDLTPRDARAVGQAYAAHAAVRGHTRIAVGRDGRQSSPSLEEALLAGLLAGGMHVRRVGVAPTPLLYFALHALRLDGGIMVTGSHNPPDENGFKLLVGTEPVYGPALAALLATAPRPRAAGSVRELPVTDAYVARLATAARETCALRVAWDCGNGATGEVVEKLVARLPGEHILLNARIDGRFPAHHPDPAVPANLRELQEAVKMHHCDLGFAFDGDGDRIGVVDADGTIVWPDQLLLLLAGDTLRRRGGATIVGDVKSSQVLFDGIAALGGRAVMAPSGYVLIREAMLRLGAPLAGEMSGHIFFAEEWYGTDDALHVAVRTLAALTRAGTSLAGFRSSLPRTHAIPEVRVPCPEERKAAVVREVVARQAAAGARMATIDGVRVSTDEGWWLLRAAGTEARLTVRCEARSERGLRDLLRLLRAELAASGIEADPQLAERCGVGSSREALAASRRIASR